MAVLGEIRSASLEPNALFDIASGNAGEAIRQNALLTQQKQQAIGAQELEVGARVASALLTLPAEQRAEAYPKLVGLAQAQGYMKQAPPSYPGDDHARALAQMGVPSATLYQQRSDTDAKRGLIPPDPSAPGATPTPGAGTGTPAAPGQIEQPAQERARAVYDGLIKRGMDHETATGFAANALHESAANPNTGTGDAGASHGLFQWTRDRYDAYIAKNGHPPDNAPLDEQLDFVLHELGGSESLARGRIAAAQGPEGKAAEISQAYLRPKDTVPEMQRRAATARQLAGLWTPNATAQQGDEAWLTEMAKRYPAMAGPNTNVNQPGGAAQTAAGGPATPAPYQVAGPTVAPPGTAVAAPVPVGNLGLVKNPATGNVSTPNAGGLGTGAPPQQPAAPAQQPAATPATPTPSSLPPVPPPPVMPEIRPSGYTDEQLRWQRSAANDPRVTSEEFRNKQAAFLVANAAAREKAYADSLNYAKELRERADFSEQSAKRADDMRRAADEADRKAQELKMQIEQHALTQKTQGMQPGQQRDESGKAVDIPGSRPPPPAGYRYADDGSQVIIPGGPADPAVIKQQADARGQGGRPMPATERDKLIKTAGQIDEIGLLKNNFNDYGNYWTASIGDMANYIARNTPGDSPRAEWWQEYQRQKLAARQAISGQSLTASELSQYEKADINPGMSNETIRHNLELQQKLLTRARDRTALSMAKDGYNPGAIEEAAAVRIADAQSRMSKDVIEQETTRPLKDTRAKVDANGKIIPGSLVPTQ